MLNIFCLFLGRDNVTMVDVSACEKIVEKAADLVGHIHSHPVRYELMKPFVPIQVYDDSAIHLHELDSFEILDAETGMTLRPGHVITPGEASKVGDKLCTICPALIARARQRKVILC